MVTVIRKRLSHKSKKAQQEAKKEHFARAYEELMEGESKPEHYRDNGKIDWDRWEYDTHQEANKQEYNG